MSEVELIISTMWLKLNCSAGWAAASLNRAHGEHERIVTLLHEAEQLGVDIAGPDINLSEVGFTVEGQCVRLGLSAIKGVGDVACTHVLRARRPGPFMDLADCITRLCDTGLDAKALSALAESGAFDGLSPERAYVFGAITSLRVSEQRQDQPDLFGESSANGEMPQDPTGPLELVAMELSRLGRVASQSVRDVIASLVEQPTPAPDDLSGLYQGKVFVEHVREHTSARGNPVVQCILFDGRRRVMGVLGPRAIRRGSLLPSSGSLIQCSLYPADDDFGWRRWDVLRIDSVDRDFSSSTLVNSRKPMENLDGQYCTNA